MSHSVLPLPDSEGTLTFYNSLVTSFSFTDGIQTIDSQNATSHHFGFATSGGNISIWEANQQIAPGSEILEQFGPLGIGFATSDQGFGSQGFGGSFNNPGVWSTSPAPEPLPTTTTCVGLALLCAMRRRNARRGADVAACQNRGCPTAAPRWCLCRMG